MSVHDHRFEPEGGDTQFGEAEARSQSRGGWFANLPVARKLNLAVFGNTILLAVLALVMLGGTWQLGQGGNAIAVLASIEVRSNNAAIALVDVVDALEQAEGAQTQRARTGSLDDARAALETAYASISDPINFAGDAMPSEHGPTVEALRDSIVGLRDDLGAARADTSNIPALRAKAQGVYDEVSTFAIDFHTIATSQSDALFKSITNFLISFVIITIVGIAISLLSARQIIGDLTGMIRRLTASMERVAAGEFETTIPGGERQDEMGAMARSLGVFRASMLKLRDLTQSRAREIEEQLAQQKLVSDQMRDLRHDKSQLLEDLANGFEVSVGEVITAVSAASEQLKATSKQMVDVADGSNIQADSASGAMENTTANVTAAAAATDEFALSISEISRQASASASLARDTTTLVTSANSRMSELSQAAEEIGEIAGLIQTIAQRTNLLALNASIEAARGGEAGRGFAVVASEVKELAMQTSNATSSVAEKISAMQDSTRSSAGDLTSIVEQISELEQVAVMIASAVDQQSVSGEELARNIDTVAESSQQVSHRLKALREASEETGAAADDVVASARALGTHADELREKAGRFITDVRRSARDLEAGGDQSDQAA